MQPWPPPTWDPGFIADGLFRQTLSVSLQGIKQFDPFFVQTLLVRVTSWKRVVAPKNSTAMKLRTSLRADRTRVLLCGSFDTGVGTGKHSEGIVSFGNWTRPCRAFDDASARLPASIKEAVMLRIRISFGTHGDDASMPTCLQSRTHWLQTAELAEFLDPCLDEASLHELHEEARTFHEKRKKKKKPRRRQT